MGQVRWGYGAAGLASVAMLLAAASAMAQQRGARLPAECRKPLVEQCRGVSDRRSCVARALPSLPTECRRVISDKARAPALAPGFTEHSYGSHPRQKLDLGLPPGAQGRSPLLLFVHGGGWTIGDKRQGAAAKGDHFLKRGWAFASTNYRLVPEATVEQQAADVAAAIAHLRRQPGIDPDRIVLMGHSAGAHLVALVGTNPAHLRAAGLSVEAIRGVILLDGAGYDVGQQMANRGNRAARMYEQAFGKDPARQSSLSPTHHAAAPNALNWLILPVASRQDSTAQSEALAARLRSAGARAIVSPQQGKTHRTLNRELGTAGDPSTAEMDAFLRSLK